MSTHDSFFIFGDSTTDSGNLEVIIGSEQFKATYPQSTNGALTNGRVWIEDIAVNLDKEYRLGGYRRVTDAPHTCEDRRSETKHSCEDKEQRGFIENRAVIGGVILSSNTDKEYKQLSYQVDGLINNLHERKYPQEQLNHWNVIFDIGANDLFRIVPAFAVWVRGFATTMGSITNATIDAQFGTTFRAILDAYVVQWNRVAQELIKHGGSQSTEHRFLVSNVQDLTYTKLFQQILAGAGITGVNDTIIPSQNLSVTTATLVFQNILKYYTTLLQARIDAWNTANQYPFVALFDVYDITTLVNTNKPLFGIDIGNAQPVWLAQDLANFANFVFNPYYKWNPCGRGALLWDNIHPTKNSHAGFAYYAQPLFTNKGCEKLCEKRTEEPNEKPVEKHQHCLWHMPKFEDFNQEDF